MQSMQDIRERAKVEVEAWFPRQCRDPFTDFHWWYVETTPERDGGFVIAPDRPSDGDYFVACSLGKGLTKEQNLSRFLDIARTLPILSFRQH